MSDKQIIAKIVNEHKAHLFTKISKLIDDKTYKYCKGVFFLNNLLIINIGNNQSIHIYPQERKIFLVDDTVSSCQDYESQNEINILNRFFSELSDIVDKIEARSRFEKALDVFIKTKKSELNTVDFYFRAELWYYKSLLSMLISDYCYKKDGRYCFELSGNKVLHVYISSKDYMTDKGVYFIQKIGNGLSTYKDSADCEPEVLVACKYLTSNEDLLKQK